MAFPVFHIVEVAVEKITGFSKRFDSTLLKANATYEEVDRFIDESVACDFRAIVVPWYLMDRVVAKVSGTNVAAACGSGFPLGYDTTDVKEYMIKKSLELGPAMTDIDITANISAIKSGDWGYFRREIEHLSSLLRNKTCKVIIEVSYLTTAEIEKACSILVEIPGVDYVKTGTGYGSRATAIEDVETIHRIVRGLLGIKVSGGVKNLSHVENFIRAGADIFGSSNAIGIYREFLEKYPGYNDLPL